MGSDGKRMFIAGKSGSGKTVFAQQQISSMPRVLIFDPKYSRGWQQGAEVLQHFAQIPKFLTDMGDGAFRAYYSPEGRTAMRRLSTLSYMLLDWQKAHRDGKIDRPITLIVEEMSDAFPLHMPGGFEGFFELVRKGREYGVSVVGIAQSPSEVNPTFRRNLDAVAAFRFSFINDRKAVAAAMQDEAVTERLAALADYEFLYFDGDKWEKHAPVAV